jgi:hypothetical protein
MFQLSPEEAESLQASRSQIATLKRGQNLKYPPYSFTEHGAIMAATVLNSPEAVKMSVFVVRAFVRMREHLALTAGTPVRVAEIDKPLLEQDQALSVIWQQLQPLRPPPRTAAPPNRLPAR